MTKDERNFYLYGVLAASEYTEKATATKILAKFNITKSKEKELYRWMDKRLKGAKLSERGMRCLQ